jgi:hypothetical protein
MSLAVEGTEGLVYGVMERVELGCVVIIWWGWEATACLVKSEVDATDFLLPTCLDPGALCHASNAALLAFNVFLLSCCFLTHRPWISGTNRPLASVSQPTTAQLPQYLV